MYNKIIAILASLLISAVAFTNNAYSFNLSKITSTSKIDSIDYKEINGASKIYVTANKRLSSANALMNNTTLVEEGRSLSNYIAKSDVTNLFIANNKQSFYHSYLFDFNKNHKVYAKFDIMQYPNVSEYTNYYIVNTYFVSKNNNIIILMHKDNNAYQFTIAIANLDKNISTRFYEFISPVAGLQLLNVDTSDNNNTKLIFSGINNDNTTTSLFLGTISHSIMQIKKLGDLDASISHESASFNLENVNSRLIASINGNIFEYLNYPTTSGNWKNIGSIGNSNIVSSTTMQYTGSTPKLFENTVYFITNDGDIYSYQTGNIVHINNSSDSDPKIEGKAMKIIAVNNNLYIVSKSSNLGNDVYNIYRSSLQ